MPYTIRDGYTQSDEFPGQGQIPKISFKYRPALAFRSAEYRGVMKYAEGKAVLDEDIKVCCEYLVSWEVLDENGAMLPVTDRAVYAKLPQPLIEFMAGCIMHYGPKKEADDAKN